MSDDDVSAMWRERREESKAKRATNRIHGAQTLVNAGFKFASHNDGAHLVVEQCVNFWPGTGLWIFYTKDLTGRGVKNLIKALDKMEGRYCG